MSRKVSIIIKDKEKQYEGLRLSLGLLLYNHQVNMFVLGHEIEVSEELLDNMEFIDEMGGARYSDVILNIHKHGFQPIMLDRIHEKLEDSEIIIPF